MPVFPAVCGVSLVYSTLLVYLATYCRTVMNIKVASNTARPSNSSRVEFITNQK